MTWRTAGDLVHLVAYEVPSYGRTPSAGVGDARKVVASRGSVDLSWRNSEQLHGDLIEGVRALESEPGGTIGMSGSVSIVRQLLEAGLLDDLHLFLQPDSPSAHGLRLFDEAATTITLPLTLRSSAAFPDGRAATWCTGRGATWRPRAATRRPSSTRHRER